MIKVLLAVRDKGSKDILKGVCCYMGCRVFVADNPNDLLNILHNEKINIIFFDLSSLFSASFDLISTINGNSQKRPVILISGQVGHVEEIDLSTNKIFYNVCRPFDPVEIEHVISAAIDAVPSKLPEKEYSTEATIVTENSIKKDLIDKLKQITFKNRFMHVLGIVPIFDRRITSSIRGINLKYLETPLSFLARPAKNIDGFIIKITRKVL